MRITSEQFFLASDATELPNGMYLCILRDRFETLSFYALRERFAGCWILDNEYENVAAFSYLEQSQDILTQLETVPAGSQELS